jgi:threonine/homoserine/homoserine lactone efflux protein
MMGILAVTEISIAGCAFLLYFAYALARESKPRRKRSLARISRVERRPAGQLLHFPAALDIRIREQRKG